VFQDGLSGDMYQGFRLGMGVRPEPGTLSSDRKQYFHANLLVQSKVSLTPGWRKTVR